MTHFMYYNNDNSNTGNPYGAQEVYNYMTGMWRDSSLITYGGNGFGGATPYSFMYDGLPGDPLAWSEESELNVPGDRRFLMSCGPFNLDAGENVIFDYAVVYTRDTISTYTIQNLYQKNKEDVMLIQQWFAVDSFPSCAFTVGVTNIPAIDNSFSIYPNPATQNITINFISPSKNVSINIYDATGRLVKNMENVKSGENTFDILSLENGLYLINVNDGKSSITKRFIKQ